MRQLAIIGPTASGKSDLAIKIALKLDAYILSIDSLSIYKEIDIVSAKPSKEELSKVKHFGIDEIYPDEHFSVDIFIGLYKEVAQRCHKDKKNLIIVGGTSFYLKSLTEGLSPLPPITHKIEQSVQEELKDLNTAYKLLMQKDPLYMQKITPNDRYRIEKALLIYRASSQTPSEWFHNNPAEAIIKDIPIFNIEVSRDVLKERIKRRTQNMLELGLIDEVASLEQRYTRAPNAMGSIGVVEVLDFLDARVTKDEMSELISTHTAQLAKRQQTFNRTQFEGVISAPLEELEGIILSQ